MSDFHFLRPLFLGALVLLPLIWLRIRRTHIVRGAWTRIIDPQLQPYVLTNTSRVGARSWTWLWYVLAAALIVALAGPTWEKLPQPVFVKQQPLVLALDLSQSMNAQDVLPSRLELAKIKLQDILARRQDGQAALLVYAGDAFVVTPMTDDMQTIISMLPSLSTSMMPEQGSRLAPALAMADQLLRQSSSQNGQVLLLTDGVSDEEAAVNAAESLRNRGHQVAVLAVGTQQGDVVRDNSGGFVRDVRGNIVIAQVPMAALQTVANAGRGTFAASRADDGDILALLETGPEGFAGAVSRENLTTDLWREQGPLIVLLCLPFIALIFRRGVLLALLMCMFVPWQQPVYAGTMSDLWNGLWSRADQQAERKFGAGEFAEAARLYTDPERAAAAYYRAEQYAESSAALQGLDSADSLYNRGNALAFGGEVEQAIGAYQAALAIDDGHEDARHNLGLLQQMQQEQQSSESDQNQQNQEQDNQDQDSQEQQQADQQQQDSEQQGDEDSESQSEEQQAQQEEQQAMEEQLAQMTEEMTEEEQQQAIEQWLRRVPDDPGGLLRRKFRRQYRERANRLPKEEQQW